MNWFFPDRFRLLVAAVCWGAMSAVWAGDLHWSLAIYGDHRMSTGAALPAGTRFQIGIFTDGFIPTAGNTGSWLAHWRGRAEVLYDVDSRGFGHTMIVEETPAPFVEGVRFYVWGFRTTGPSTSEWILATHDTWMMPSADPLEFPVYLNLSDGDVILGSADPGNHTIATAAVNIGETPGMRWEDWLSQRFFRVQRENAAISGETADPDGDGLTNWMEYSLGSDPLTADTGSQAAKIAVRKSGAAVSVEILGTPTVSPASIVETSTDLKVWVDEETVPVFQADSQRWVFVKSLEARRFWRLGGR